MPTVSENLLGALRLLEALQTLGVTPMLTIGGQGTLAVHVSYGNRRCVHNFPAEVLRYPYLTPDVSDALDALVEEVKKPRCKICGRPVDDGVQFCGGDECVPL